MTGRACEAVSACVCVCVFVHVPGVGPSAAGVSLPVAARGAG